MVLMVFVASRVPHELDEYRTASFPAHSNLDGLLLLPWIFEMQTAWYDGSHGLPDTWMLPWGLT